MQQRYFPIKAQFTQLLAAQQFNVKQFMVDTRPQRVCGQVCAPSPRWYAVSCALTSMIRAAQSARCLLMHWLQDGIDLLLDTEELVRDAEDMSTRMMSVVTNMRANAAFQEYFPSNREGGGA